MDKWWGMFQNKPSASDPEPDKNAEPMTTHKVDFNYRVYWTKMSLPWTAEDRARIRGQVDQVRQQSDFENNLLEKRYYLPIEDVPEEMHSGASVLALLEVLNTLDQMEQKNE